MKTVIVLNKKQIGVALTCALLIAAVPFLTVLFTDARLAVAAGASGSDWGLSFQQAGQPPVANADAASLGQYNAHYIGDTDQKVLYLTFDAGFENGHTPAILDALRKHGVSATFFLVEHYLNTSPDLVKRMVDEGHTVGNHTASHPDMSKIADKAAFQQELQTLEAAYKEITGQDMPKIYRPPQGKYSESNLKMAQELGYATVFWSLAYVDWYVDDQPTPEKAMDTLLSRTHNGAVVLLHSTSATNAAILDDLLTAWEKQGYTFGTLPELCGVR